ncbi:MAG TPA: immunity 70 family protein [Treponemataceae bacterium]|nr:immunity 70 family protein [Treponemataceae bacterium]
MAVGFKVRFYWFQVGTSSFLHSFFSTVCYNLEGKNWGSKYPCIMKELYQGELKYENIATALIELKDIKSGLSLLSPDKVIWDIDNLELSPPWGTDIAPTITDLGNYFITSEGEDFLSVFDSAMQKALKLKTELSITEI